MAAVSAAAICASGCGVEATPDTERAAATVANVAHVGPKWGAAWPTPTPTPTPLPTLRPTPAPKPAPVPTFDRGTVQARILELWPRAQTKREALVVADCETGGTFNPGARNGDHFGLFQLRRRFHEHRAVRLGYVWDRDILTVEANVAVGADLQAEQGWRPWACRPGTKIYRRSERRLGMAA